MKQNVVNTKNIKRINPDIDCGLSSTQVEQRKEMGLSNIDTGLKTKSIKRIIRDNLFTLFNLLNFALALAVFIVGSYKNLIFMGVVICNTVISTYQEIRAKITVDKLSIISSIKVKVLRDNEIHEIHPSEIVLDDILCLEPGNQIVADCILMQGELDVNEALLTGESDLINKKTGDSLFSGSFVVSGKCKAKVEHIGDDNYANKISNQAKYVKKINSEIMTTINKIIKTVSILIIPIGALLFWNQLSISAGNYNNAVVNTVAALIGMIPEGLVLLTSTVLAVGIIRLSRHKVLVQELYCIETLARVDTLCLDKTGTLTDSNMEVFDIIPLKDGIGDDIDKALNALSGNLTDNNSTFNAIKRAYDRESNYKLIKTVPFSSDKKWSGASFEEKGSYIIGAPEMVLKNSLEDKSGIESEIKKYIDQNRVLILVHSSEVFCENNELPNSLEAMALILINDTIRPSAKKTLEYFEDQGVGIKIISGDNVKTVSNIAKSVGMKDYDKYIDASTLKTDEDIKNAVDKYTIFGRVSPMQKKEIVLALKERGKTVAMTGDGVNDVLALKEADCSIAVASGSEAARSVSQLVLLDSNFDSMPRVVAEGRRSINNIQRSASLFLVKTIYSTLLAVIFLFIKMHYPFMPIQMTLTSMFTIGIPSFILALEPNKERIKGNFLLNIISKAFPGALTVVFNIILIVILSNVFSISYQNSSTLSVILTGYTGLMLLYKISIPFDNIRKILFISMALGFTICIFTLKGFFSLSSLTMELGLYLAFLILAATVFFMLMLKLFGKRLKD